MSRRRGGAEGAGRCTQSLAPLDTPHLNIMTQANMPGRRPCGKSCAWPHALHALRAVLASQMADASLCCRTRPAAGATASVKPAHSPSLAVRAQTPPPRRAYYLRGRLPQRAKRDALVHLQVQQLAVAS